MVPGAVLRLLGDQGIVLGMHADPLAGGQGVGDRGDELLVIVQQDVPRGGTHEKLESRDKRCEH